MESMRKIVFVFYINAWKPIVDVIIIKSRHLN